MIDVRVVTIDRLGTGDADHTAHPDFDTTIWNNLPNIQYRFVMSDKGDASWEVPLSHTQLADVSLGVARDRFSPIASDYRIGINNDNAGWVTVQEGIVGPVGLHSDTQIVSVQGFDYLWWLEQPYRFTGYQVAQSAWTAANILKYWNLGTIQQQIITDLIANTWSGNSLQSLHLTPSFVGSGWSTSTLEHIIIGDATTVLEKIKALASYNDPLGFDFTLYPGSIVNFWSPRKNAYIPSSTNIVGRFTPSLGNLIDIDWTNNGPRAVTTVGIPSFGVAFTKYSSYTASKNTYRDWWQIYRPLKDTYHLHTQAALDSATDARATLDRNPQKQLSITIKPDVSANLVSGVSTLDPTFWFKNKIGEYVYVDSEDWFLPYHRIQSYFIIIAQDISGDNVGNWTCKLTLEQIY